MGSARRRVVVIGGGITGLAAANRLVELAAERQLPVDVSLLEATNRVGGALETIHRDGFVIETGADSFLSEKPAALALASRLGLTDEVRRTQEEFRKTLVVRDGRLVEIPPGFSLIAPTWLAPIWRSRLFSTRAKLRMSLEPLIPRRRGSTDESVASMVTRRLGRQVLERVAQPLAAGIYTADPANLSAAATMPRFVAMERRYGSLVKGLRAAQRGRDAESRQTSGARWSLFVSFRNGVGSLVEALAGRLGDLVLRGNRVTALEPLANGWRIRLANRTLIDADVLISTLPAPSISELIRPHDGPLAASLEKIRYASAGTVNLAFRRTDFPALPSSFGFVVPAVEKRQIIAGSFSSLKFADRAPTDMILMRVFIGGALDHAMMSLNDDDMIAAARGELKTLLGVSARPLFTVVRRWPESMPQYVVGHLDRLAVIRARAAQLPRAILAGAWLDGVGIPDCVRQGEAAAEAALSSLNGSPP